MKFDITVDDQINKKIDEIDISNKKLESNIKELHRIIEYLVKSNELLVKKNNQLETQNQMQKEFISITAHDLRTSIQSIIWYSELLEIDPQLCEKYVNLIIRNIKRLERLTQNILDVARIENNLLRLDKQRFNLENLILLVINEYKQQLDKDEKSNDLQITYENPKQDDKGIIIYADKARVTQ
ncbi:MAG TPA: histidine kinase dimerization/phospho-acceptor domain-containing protein, partial [Verrucomicrobiae bacterium]|nr:histidine kinase dimerization/phospho-acceptor domain-containing protein [Verrucomicrobiae bacterium]